MLDRWNLFPIHKDKMMSDKKPNGPRIFITDGYQPTDLIAKGYQAAAPIVKPLGGHQPTTGHGGAG